MKHNTFDNNYRDQETFFMKCKDQEAIIYNMLYSSYLYANDQKRLLTG